MPVPTTVDTLLRGAVTLEQPASGYGYRFNADAVLLASFAVASRKSVGTLIDLGAGVGAVALCVAHLRKVDRMVLVDIDPEACELARRNLARNALGAIGSVYQVDIGQCGQRSLGSADLVVMNPPYTGADSGRRPRCVAVDKARHGDIGPFVRVAGRLLRDEHASACLCHPTGSLVQVFRLVRDAGLYPTKCAFVYPAPGRAARIVLLEVGRRAAGLVIEPPIIEKK